MAIQKIVTDDALSAFASDVKAAIANVSSPLVYKGTLGTGGTISTLPAASASNNGFAYVVITAGTYQGVVCAVGDVIASNGTAWNIIPQANSAETLPITTGSAVNTKEYIDTKTTLVKSASGSLIHISDGGDNIPMKSLVSEIVAVESGSGEKSPTNPYTISGFNSGVVKVSNHSTVIETSTQKYVDADGIITQSVPSFPYKYVIARVKQGETYTYSVNGVATTISVMAFFDKYPLIGSQSYNSSRLVEQNATFTSPITGFVFIRGSGDFNEVNQMVATGTNTEYEQGNTYTFTFGQTVYGGHFENKGNLVVTHKYRLFDGVDSQGWQYQRAYGSSLRFNYTNSDIKPNSTSLISNMFEYSAVLPDIEGISTHSSSNMIVLEISSSRLGGSTVADLMTFFANNNLQVVYELTTPITLSITSQDIPTLSGENNIFSNCGDTAIEYFTSSADGLAALIREQPAPIHKYSTSEHVVGVWIDNKTLYEKTLVIEGSNLTAGQSNTIAHGISNIDFIQITEGSFIFGNGTVKMPLPFSDEYKPITNSLVVIEGITDTAIKIGVGSNYINNASPVRAWITLQYTKTT